MNTFLRGVRLAFACMLAGVALSAQAANTATVTPSVTTYSAVGGNITFTVSLGYSGSLSGLQIVAIPPTGWTYLSATGANVPQLALDPNDLLGADGVGFTYTSFPVSPATFSFTVSYPAGMTGNKSITGIQAAFTDEASDLVSIVNLSAITLSPAPSAPVITTAPASQTVTAGQSATFTVAASGNPAPTFTWQQSTNAGGSWTTLSDGGRISGATTGALVISGVRSTDAASYRAVAANSQQSNVTSAAASLMIDRAAQTITFGSVAGVAYGAAPFSLTATASSGLGVSYTSSNLAVATVSGSTVTVVGAGTTKITASQLGNTEFTPAQNVQQTLGVGQAGQTIAFATLPQKTFGDADFDLQATATSGLAVSYTSSNPAVATVAGTKLTILGAGTATITASQSGGGNFAAATGVERTLTVAQKSQTITFGALAQKSYGAAPFKLGASVDSPLGVTYSSSNSAVATVSGDMVTLAGVGTTTITASQSGNGNYRAATAVNQTLTVVAAAQTITFAPLAARTFVANDPLALGATASSGLTVTYASSNPAVATVSGSTLTVVGAGSVTITASQSGNANFGAAADVKQDLTVNRATATVTLGSLAATFDGTAKAATATTVPADLAVGFTYGGSSSVPTAAGSYAVVATVNHANYSGTASGSLVIAKAAQTLTFDALSAVTFGAAPFDLNATATSSLSVAFASSNPLVATVSGKTVTIVGAGTTVITAGQGGDSNYAAATSVSRTLVVNKAAATVTLGGLAPTYTGSARSATASTEPPGLAVGFTYNTAPTAPTAAGSYAVAAVVNDANYTGTATGTLVIAKATPTLTFAALPSRALDEVSFNLAGTSTSGRPLTFVSSDSGVATIGGVNGNTVTLVHAGTTTITASQPEEANYLAATSVAQSLTVTSASQAITFAGTELAGKTYGNEPVALRATSNRGLTVAFASSNPDVAQISGETLTIVGAGSAVITASQAGNADFARATDVTRTLVVAKATATVTLAQLSPTYDGTAKAVTATTAPSGLSVGITYDGKSNAPTAAGSYTVVGTVNDANYAGTVSRTLSIAPASQAITFDSPAAKNLSAGTFALDATASSGLPVTYTSSVAAVATVNGSTVTLVGPGTANITAKQAGNSNYLAASDVTRTLVVNTVPVITAQPVSTSVNQNGTATFTVVATGYPAPAFQWKKGGNVIPGNASATTAMLTLTNAQAADEGDYTVELTNDAGRVTSTPAATLTVYVLPVITTQPGEQTVLAGQGASFSVVATGKPAPTYQWRRNGTAITGATNASLAFTNLALTDGAAFTVVVSNVSGSFGGSVTSNPATLTVDPIAPVILATPPLAATAVRGRDFLFGPVTLNNTPVTFSATGLPDGLSVNPTLGTISGSPLNTGASTIVLTATNKTGRDSRTISLTVHAPPPVITSAASAGGRVGSAFTFNVVATNAPTTYAAANLPAGLSLDTGNGTISGTPTAAGTTTVQLTVRNAAGEVSQPLVLAIAPPPNAPVYAGPLNLSGTQGSAYSYTPAFGLVTAPYALTGALPAGLAFSTATGAISGTPTQTGVFPLTLSATNAGGTTAANLNLVINAAATAPVITSSSVVPGARVGTAFNFQLTSAGTPAATSYSAGGLPAGLALTAGTGVISGTPTVFGTFAVTVSATNTVGTGPASILSIAIAPSAAAPVITSAPVVNQGQVGVGFSFTLTASPAATGFAVTSGTLPAGLSLSAATGVVTGTPSVAGQTRVWFAAANVSGTGLAMEVLFSIAPAAATPVVNSNGYAGARVGLPFQYVITATNGPITAFAAAGRPAWLALDATTGVLSGVPPEENPQLVLSLSAANGAGNGSPKTVIVNIAPAPATPLVTSPLTAGGRVGVAFSHQVTGSETPTSYVATGLPDGLSLDPATGAITGTPTVSKTYSVVLRAANAAGLGATSTLVIAIAPAVLAPAIVSASAASAQVGAAFTYSIVATNGPILSYAVNGGQLPAALALNTATGVISGTPADAPRIYLVELTASNATSTSLPQVLAINVAPALGVPALTTPLYATAVVGADFTFTITATNLTGSAPYAPPILLDAVGLPSGLAVNPATGVISGRPVATGTAVVSLIATNAAGTGPTRDLTIAVQPAPAAPVVGGGALAVGQVGQPFTYQIVASNTPTSYEVIGAPAWMSLNSATGAISGVPAAPGAFTVQLAAGNASGTSDLVTLGLLISPAANTPVITSTRTAAGTVGTAFTYTPSATPASTGYVASGLPGGLAINAATGAITGTPNVSGTFKVVLTPANANGVGAPATIVLTILPNVTFGN